MIELELICLTGSNKINEIFSRDPDFEIIFQTT